MVHLSVDEQIAKGQGVLKKLKRFQARKNDLYKHAKAMDNATTKEEYELSRHRYFFTNLKTDKDKLTPSFARKLLFGKRASLNHHDVATDQMLVHYEKKQRKAPFGAYEVFINDCEDGLREVNIADDTIYRPATTENMPEWSRRVNRNREQKRRHSFQL